MVTFEPCVHGTHPANCKACTDSFNRRNFSLLYNELAVTVDVDGNIIAIQEISYDPSQNDISEINAVNFGDNMKKHIPEIDPNVLAEHAAQHEWEERKALVAEVRRMFLSLTTELKREVLKDVCMYCLRESRDPCHCENDE